MTYDNGSILAAEAQLREEHRELNGFLKRVLELKSFDSLGALLGELHTLLHRHFANEEYPGGLYERMGVLGPQFREDVRFLVDDHFRMLAAVREMTDRLDRGEEAAEIVEELHGLVAWMREHEEREHRMAAGARRRD